MMKQGTTWKSQHENDGLSKYGGMAQGDTDSTTGTGSTSNNSCPPPRDLVGYGNQPPSTIMKWPNNNTAKVAINFVINYEEGGESCILHGDTQSEHLLSDIIGQQPYENERNLNMESLYDYGSRAGFWRYHRLFTARKIPVTVFAVGMALERNPAVCRALKETTDWEVASHGYRWIDYRNVDEETEREHIERTIKIHEKLIGKRPVGMYQGKPSLNTRKLIINEGGFKYDSDSYADDLPYWTLDYGNAGKPHLIVPYTLSENDMHFTSSSNFSNGAEFGQYLKDTLKFLIEEGKGGRPKMMSIGLHCRLARPGRVSGLVDFLDFIKSHRKDVWVCTREQIADFWYENHYPRGGGSPMKERVITTEPLTNDDNNDEVAISDVETEVVFTDEKVGAKANISLSTEVEIVPAVEGGYTTLGGGEVGQEEAS